MRENRIRRMDKVSCTLIINTRLVEPKMNPKWGLSNGRNGLIFPYNFWGDASAKPANTGWGRGLTRARVMSDIYALGV